MAISDMGQAPQFWPILWCGSETQNSRPTHHQKTQSFWWKLVWLRMIDLHWSMFDWDRARACSSRYRFVQRIGVTIGQSWFELDESTTEHTTSSNSNIDTTTTTKTTTRRMRKKKKQRKSCKHMVFIFDPIAHDWVILAWALSDPHLPMPFGLYQPFDPGCP